MPDAAPTVQVQLLPAVKPWYGSRTLWLNAIVLGLAAAEARLGLLKDVLPISLFQLLAFALPVVNLVLRTVTSTAIAAGPQPTTQANPQEKAP